MYEGVNESEIKENFSGIKYNYIKEFFYHVNTDDYTIKVMITRRSYSLYKLFTDILSSKTEKDVFEYNGKKNPKKGVFLNSHSICYIDYYIREVMQANDNTSPLKILLVDDIVINGRTVSKTYKMIEKIVKNYNISYDLSVWCLALNDTFNEGYGLPREKIKTYRPVNDQIWKDESTSLTQAILKSNQGYTSYLRVFESDKSVLELKNALINIGWSIEELKGKKDINEYYCAYKKAEYDSHKSFVPFIRFYKKQGVYSGSLVIPYVFILKTPKENIMQLYNSLSEEYSIGNIPECFKDADKNKISALHFYKWLTYESSNMLINDINKQLQLNIKMVFDCPESFYGIDDKNYDYYSCDDAVDQNYSSEIKECYDLIRNHYSNSKDIYVSIKNYLIEMRDKDDLRAKNNAKRYIGLSTSDFFNDKIDSTKPEEWMTKILYSWDIGKASGNPECIKINNQDVLDTFIRQGEQVFLAPYADMEKEFIIVSYFAKQMRNFDPDQLESIALEFDKKYKKYKTVELLNELINHNIKKEVFYSDVIGLELVYNQIIKKQPQMLEAKMDAYDFIKKKGLSVW